MTPQEEKIERRKTLKTRMFYLLVILDLLLFAYLVFEVIFALKLIK